MVRQLTIDSLRKSITDRLTGMGASESARVFLQLKIEQIDPPREGEEEKAAALCNLLYGFRLYPKSNVRSTPRITAEVWNEIDDAVTACVKDMSDEPEALVNNLWCDTKEICKLKIGELVTHGECLIELARVAPASEPVLRDDKGWHRELREWFQICLRLIEELCRSDSHDYYRKAEGIANNGEARIGNKYLGGGDSSGDGAETALQPMIQHLQVLRGFVDKGSLPTRGDSKQEKPPQHSPDFRSVTSGGRTYAFTANQAEAVRILWEAYEKEAPDVGQDYILAQIECHSKRLRDVFKNSEAWSSIITEGTTKGTYRLKL